MNDERTDVLRSINGLVDSWCERRSLPALGEILQGWPLTSGLTDDWAQLGEALRGVRAFAPTELTEDEMAEVDRLIAVVDRLVTRR
jgi:hypothetical protein